MPRPEIDLILRNIDLAYEANAWHGTNLRGSLRGLGLEVVSFRPDPARHNIWELAVHCAYWKYAVRRRLAGAKKGSFPLAGSNFFVRPSSGAEGGTAAAWRRDLELLGTMHREMRAEIARLPARRLAEVPRGSKRSNLEMLLGVAAHDVYHAGQIQLLKRLAREPGRRRG